MLVPMFSLLFFLLCSSISIESRLVLEFPIRHEFLTFGRRYRVLVTGYQPFHNKTTNPAEQIALKLNGECDRYSFKREICWEGLSLPVSREGASVVANRLATTAEKWDAIIHLGLEDSSKGLKIETIAVNVLAGEENPSSNAAIPCRKNGTTYDDIKPEGDCVLPTTAPLNRLNLPETLVERDIEVWSRDAGAYYCNEVYYRTLHELREQSNEDNFIPAIFIHLPEPEAIPIATSLAIVRHIGQKLLF